MTIETQIQTIIDTLAALTAKVDSLATPPSVDLSPVLTAIAAVDAKIGTPPVDAPAPVAAA